MTSGNHRCAIATIAARNYLASLVLLGESVMVVDPEADFFILIIDAVDSELEDLRLRYPTFRWLGVDNVGVEPSQLTRMAFYYDVTEFATSLKPWLLSTLLETFEVAIYLDPDIEVFDDLSCIEDLARQHEVVLTPHVLRPVPRDGLQVAEESFLLSGHFNLGFIAVSNAASNFLEYWKERLGRYSLHRVSEGYFTDQRWVDAVPTLFDHIVVKDPGWNVAYWNLHERRIVDTGEAGPSHRGSFLINGWPLRFFHFSGHRAERPLTASVHSPKLRVDIKQDAALVRIFTERAQRILAFDQEAAPYRWGYFLDGRPIPQVLRTAYWHAVDDAIRTGDPLPPSPFDADAGAAFDEWLSERIEFDLPRIALLWVQFKPDFVASFGELNFDNVRWLPHSLLNSPDFVASARLGDLEVLESMLPRNIRNQPGINLIGYLLGEFGLGVHARGIASSVLAAGLPLSLSPLTAPGHVHQAQSLPGVQSLAYDVNVVCVNADVLPQLAQDALWQRIKHQPIVGVWNWELPQMAPEMVACSELLDEIWCGSEFIAESIRSSGAHCEVYVHPLCIEAPAPTKLLRADLGLCDDGFTFGFSFDYRSVERRKNPLGLVRAYREAFQGDDGVQLVIKTINATPEELDKLGEAVRERSDIRVIARHWSDAQMRAFYQLIDCYVSLHRSEGIGLTMAAAMASGTPVIATGWSGNMSFMNESSAALIPVTMTEVGLGSEPYAPDALWAEPDESAAIDAMRSLATDPKVASALGERGREHLLTIASPQVAGAWISTRYREISKGRGRQR